MTVGAERVGELAEHAAADDARRSRVSPPTRMLVRVWPAVIVLLRIARSISSTMRATERRDVSMVEVGRRAS